MQVAPAELQGYLLQHPAVADVSVVPIPNKFAGELPRAYIVRSAASNGINASNAMKELHTYVNDYFPTYKQLAGGIEFLEALPKTASGKVQRGLLKDMAKASIDAQVKRAKAADTPLVRVYEFDSDTDDE
jgi:acyl-coenzyme A synthetase/AMP-(fatty) acid ligase